MDLHFFVRLAKNKINDAFFIHCRPPSPLRHKISPLYSTSYSLDTLLTAPLQSKHKCTYYNNIHNNKLWGKEKKTHSFSEALIKCRTLALKLAKNNIKQNSIASMVSLTVCDLRIGLLLRWLAAGPPLGACSAMVFIFGFRISDFGRRAKRERRSEPTGLNSAREIPL